VQKLEVDVAIIGSGTAGLYALSEVKRSGKTWVLIQGGPVGTTCARVGCMPSKLLLKTADLYAERAHFAAQGINGADGLSIDPVQVMTHLRSMRDQFVSGVTSKTTDRMDEDHFVRGFAKFTSTNSLKVNDLEVSFKKAIIATGSTPIVPASWSEIKGIYTTDNLFEINSLPKSLAVVGLGAIGLEIGQAMSQLGVLVVGFDQANTLASLQDESLKASAIEYFNNLFPIHLGESVELEQAQDGSVSVKNSQGVQRFDAVLLSLGRRSNIGSMDIENAGVELTNGYANFDPESMQIADTNIYLSGDVTGDRAVMHEAADEGLIAGYNASVDVLEQKAFKRKTPLGIVFTEPNIARVGDLTMDDSVVSVSQPIVNGRAKVKKQSTGGIVLHADARTGKLRGAELVSTEAEHMAHLLAWAIEQNSTVADLQKMPVYHPVLEEALMSAIEALGRKLEPQLSTAEHKLHRAI
jgi:dihydrolipoamide dehydrogenase